MIYYKIQIKKITTNFISDFIHFDFIPYITDFQFKPCYLKIYTSSKYKYSKIHPKYSESLKLPNSKYSSNFNPNTQISKFTYSNHIFHLFQINSNQNQQSQPYFIINNSTNLLYQISIYKSRLFNFTTYSFKNSSTDVH